MQPRGFVKAEKPSTSSGNSLGNPVTFADIAVKVAPDDSGVVALPPATIVAAAPAPRAQPAPVPTKEDKALEKDLKEISKDVKDASGPQQNTQKPILAIVVAVLVAIGLSAAAFFAFNKN